MAFNPQTEKADEEDIVKRMNVSGLPLCGKCYMHHNGECF